jgi:ubiquinone/menaquinone biosynthesis C-methylase UbiE
MKTVLHVGCGPRNASPLHAVFRTPDWREVRLDIDAAVEPDIVCSMTDMQGVAAASADAIWSSHNIEHLDAHEIGTALGEFRRTLKPGGFALIATPDLQEVCRHVAEGRLEDTLYVSPGGPIAAIDILYGWRRDLAQGRSYMAHRTGFTRATLKARLVEAGFAPVAVQVNQKGFELTALAYSGVPDQAELQTVLKALQAP